MKIHDLNTFSEILTLHAFEKPDEIWIHDLNTNEDYSFSKFNDLVNKTVSFLIDKNCSPGDNISVIINNRIEFLILFFASLRLGTRFNPFPFSLSSNNIAKYLDLIDPKIVFCQNQHYEELKSYKPLLSYEVVNDQLEDSGYFNIIDDYDIYSGKDFSPIDNNEIACIYYSSGTTGEAKGIAISHRNMISNISSIVRGFKWESGDCHFIFLPFGHTASINYSILPCMYAGASIVICESFWKVRINIWEYIQKYGVTYMEVVPSTLFIMVNMPYKNFSRRAIKHFKYIGCGSAPLPLDVQEAINQKFDIKVGNLYGLSETGPTHVDDPLEEDWKPGSIGKALDVNQVKIFNDDGIEVENREIGEIGIKGENVFIGYYKNEKKYMETFKNEYFLTGDIGYKDDNDIFYFSDRKKDLIIKGGVNISPAEIDEVLFAHPAVTEAATIGVQDSYLGEIIKSYVVLKNNQNINPNVLKDYCLGIVGEFKCPNEIVFLNELPKGPSGKILKRELREKG
tara:strand:- start:104 stop:1636 length:1533 start_codon:yes stop_codon:yes gene_type:complete